MKANWIASFIGMTVFAACAISTPALAVAGEPVELTLSKNRGDQFSITHNAPTDLV